MFRGPESKQGTPSEHELVRRVTEFLTQDGYRVRLEVPTLGQSADILATRGRWMTLVEVKTSDWQRALEQCRAHELVADFVCVAIGTASAPEGLRNAALELGYGVIHCRRESSDCWWDMRPRLNRGVWRPQRERLTSVMRKIGYEY